MGIRELQEGDEYILADHVALRHLHSQRRQRAELAGVSALGQTIGLFASSRTYRWHDQAAFRGKQVLTEAYSWRYTPKPTAGRIVMD